MELIAPQSVEEYKAPAAGQGRPRTGRRYNRDFLLFLRPERQGKGWGLSARHAQSGAPETAPLASAGGEAPSREALLAIRSALSLNRRPDGDKVEENTALLCPLQIR